VDPVSLEARVEANTRWKETGDQEGRKGPGDVPHEAIPIGSDSADEQELSPLQCRDREAARALLDIGKRLAHRSLPARIIFRAACSTRRSSLCERSVR